MSIVSVVQFTKMAGPYRTGDQAGFDPDLARQYVDRGFAKMVSEHVPKIDPKVVASDALRTISELRASLVRAEGAAKAVAQDPTASATAAEALESAAAARAQLAALERQLAAAGHLAPPGESRRPNPAGKAA